MLYNYGGSAIDRHGTYHPYPPKSTFQASLNTDPNQWWTLYDFEIKILP